MTRSDDTNDDVRRHPSAAARHERIGRYLVLGVLGRGGMGEVLRARAIGAAGATKEVCIKRIRASRLTDRRAIERFVHEARLSLALTHANIVATFDFGRADHDYFLAMEWIDGADLRRIQRDAAGAPLSIGAIAHVGAEIARALRHAHGERSATGVWTEPIVHCDVKPSNLLVSKSGDVKLADFGVAVARLADHRGGTPRYTAPEVRDGGAVTPAADVYGLGVVLSELLTAEPRPALEEPLETVRVALDSLIASMLSVAPSDRPDARQVVSTLEELVARARVAGGRSARDELGERAARSAPVLDAPLDPSAELDPEASYLRDGQSDLETRLTATTSSAREPPRTGPNRSFALPLVVSALALLATIAIATRSVDPPHGELAPPTRDTTATGVQPAPTQPTATQPTAGPADVLPATEPTVLEPVTAEPTVVEPHATTVPTTVRRGGVSPRIAVAPPRSEPASEALPAPTTEVATDMAIVRINATPWADVEIDGRHLGATPLMHVELAPGPHTIVLVNPVLSRVRTEHVELAPGERRDVIVAM